MGEQNIVFHTDMYIQAVQEQQTKGIRAFLEAKTGLDSACYDIWLGFRTFPTLPALSAGDESPPGRRLECLRLENRLQVTTGCAGRFGKWQANHRLYE